ncbi:MAG TPA: rhomboid family intramembrane serine protease [Chitinophagaceae bacterium]|nr:rhomboid family intramembrane serine protease [Chitinophagaceae bacterium]
MAVKHQNQKNNILLGQNDNALTWLIIVNIVAFVIIYFVKVLYNFSYQDDHVKAGLMFQQNVLGWLTLPASFDKFITRPWTIVTFMFTHDGILQLISTVLWLWGFGYILQDLAGNSKLIPIYLYGGIAGGIFFLLAVHLLPAYSHQLQNVLPFISGSASVMAVAVATTVLSPNYKIFPMINGGIPLWILTSIFVVVQFASIAIANGGFAIGHLGSALLGFLFIYQLRRGRDWGAWMGSFVGWVDDLFNPEKKLSREDARQKLFYKAVKKPFVKKTVVTQQRVDDLLDKINQKGYHLLTDEEKEFLKKASEEDL